MERTRPRAGWSLMTLVILGAALALMALVARPLADGPLNLLSRPLAAPVLQATGGDPQLTLVGPQPLGSQPTEPSTFVSTPDPRLHPLHGLDGRVDLRAWMLVATPDPPLYLIGPQPLGSATGQPAVVAPGRDPQLELTRPLPPVTE